MWRIARWLFLLYLVLICESTWVPHVQIGTLRPDLAFGLVFALALRFGGALGLWSAFGIGLLHDLESPERLGLHSLAYVLAALAVDRWSHNFDRTNPVVMAVLFLITGLISETTRMIWLGQGEFTTTLKLVFGRGWGSALYTAVIVPPLSWLFSHLVGDRGWVLRAT